MTGKKTTRILFLTAGVALFILPFSIAALADSETDSSAEHQHDMYEEMQESDDFNATLEKQQKSVSQQLEDLKAKTRVSYEPLVKQEDAPYFNQQTDTPPVAEEPQPEPTYVYKKKGRQAAPSRSFNNVQ